MKHLNPNVPLGRVPYLVAGVLLMALKVGVDAALAARFGRVYSLLFYFDPTTAPLFRRAEMNDYWVALCYATAPFAVLGVLLTLRRLKDAGASPLLALFFFVPFANLLFFVATALLPPHRAGATTVVDRWAPFRWNPLVVAVPPRPRSASAAIVYSGALGMVVALGGFAISVGLLGRYGYGLALGLPFVSGFVSGAWVTRLLPTAKLREAVLASFFAMAISLALLVLAGAEGLGCLILFLPVLVSPAIVGAVLGFQIGRAVPRKEHAVAGSVLLLLGTFAVEELGPRSAHQAEVVETAMTIDAPPSVVWPLVVRVAPMDPPLEAPFNAGIAYPIRATLERDGVGAVRTCEFDTGVALETVTVWEPERRLRFTIDRQPDLMRELTIYRTVRQPHLDGAVRNRAGELELVPLDGGERTLLVGRSWYETTLHPTGYFEAYADYVIRAVHRRVMGHVKARAEAATRPIAER